MVQEAQCNAVPRPTERRPRRTGPFQSQLTRMNRIITQREPSRYPVQFHKSTHMKGLHVQVAGEYSVTKNREVIPVDVVLPVGGEVVVDNQGHLLDINASSLQIKKIVWSYITLLGTVYKTTLRL